MVSEYYVDIHLTRLGTDYHSDVYTALYVNNVDTHIEADKWMTALGMWVNATFDLRTRARSTTGIELALFDAGYRFAFLGQDYEDGGHIIRHYKISAVDPVENRYFTRHLIAGTASEIISLAIDDKKGDLDMAREVDKLCEKIINLTAKYEGQSVGRIPLSYLHQRNANADHVAGIDVAFNRSLVVGDRVMSPKFGHGVVVEVNKGGGDLDDDLCVAFDDYGVKRLATGFAPLEPVPQSEGGE